MVNVSQNILDILPFVEFVIVPLCLFFIVALPGLPVSVLKGYARVETSWLVYLLRFTPTMLHVPQQAKKTEKLKLFSRLFTKFFLGLLCSRHYASVACHKYELEYLPPLGFIQPHNFLIC